MEYFYFYYVSLDYNSRPVIELMIVVDSAFMAKYSEMSIRGGVTLYLMTLLSMMANLYRLGKNKGPDVMHLAPQNVTILLRIKN